MALDDASAARECAAVQTFLCAFCSAFAPSGSKSVLAILPIGSDIRVESLTGCRRRQPSGGNDKMCSTARSRSAGVVRRDMNGRASVTSGGRGSCCAQPYQSGPAFVSRPVAGHSQSCAHNWRVAPCCAPGRCPESCPGSPADPSVCCSAASLADAISWRPKPHKQHKRDIATFAFEAHRLLQPASLCRAALTEPARWRSCRMLNRGGAAARS
jgi:hypothetical protein